MNQNDIAKAVWDEEKQTHLGEIMPSDIPKKLRQMLFKVNVLDKMRRARKRSIENGKNGGGT